MEIYDYAVSFREIPLEINLTFFVHGCQLNCKGCFWDKTRKPYKLGFGFYEELLFTYANKCTAVVFLGGEWCSDLSKYLNIAKDFEYKTCLYTGLEYFEFEQLEKHKELLENLDYIKVGRYIECLGSLYEEGTNQKLIRLKDNTVILGNLN